MRRIHLLSGIFWCLILLHSCTTGNSISPEVEFISPTIHSSHDLESKLDVEIDISDDEMITEYTFWLESEHGHMYFKDQKDINKSFYKLKYQFDLSDDIVSDFSIHMEVKDNEGNKTSKSLDITTSK